MSSLWACAKVQTIEAKDHDKFTRPYTPSLPDNSTDLEALRQDPTVSEPGKDDTAAVKQFETPRSSVHQASVASKPSWLICKDKHSRLVRSPFIYKRTCRNITRTPIWCVFSVLCTSWMHGCLTSMRAALGVLVFGVATAAVLWCVKPEC